MNLGDLFISKTPRETSGATSANRFSFQQDWALCKLLDLHEATADYVIGFEFHEDVVVLDSATAPKALELFQIKTKANGNWTRKALTARKKGKEELLPSVLGKLYDGARTFPEHAAGLFFVTNASFNFKLASESSSLESSSIRIVDLTAVELKAVKDAIKLEHGLSADPDLGLVRCVRDPLSLHEHATHALGKLTAFVDGREGCTTVRIRAFYRALKGDIEQRSTREGVPRSFVEFCSTRAITRSQFDQMLTQVVASEIEEDPCGVLRTYLMAEGLAFSVVEPICAAARRHLILRLDPTNSVLQAAEKLAKASAAKAGSTLPGRLFEAIEWIRVNGDFSEATRSYSEDHLRALIGIILHERQQPTSIPPTNPAAQDQGS